MLTKIHMADIWQTIFLNVFHCKKITVLSFKIHWSLFLRVEFTNLINPTGSLPHIPQYTIQNRNVHICVLDGVFWGAGLVHCGFFKYWSIHKTISVNFVFATCPKSIMVQGHLQSLYWFPSYILAKCLHRSCHFRCHWWHQNLPLWQSPLLVSMKRITESNKSDCKRRNTLGCLDQYTCNMLRLWNSRDHETV